MPYKLSDEQIKEMLEDRRKGMDVKALSKKYNMCYALVSRYTNYAIQNGWMTEEELKKMIGMRGSNRKGHLKLGDDYIKALIEDRKQGMCVKDLKKKYGIGRKAYQSAMRKAYELGLITPEEHEAIALENVGKIPQKIIEKHGKEKAIKIWQQRWFDNLGKYPKKLREAGRQGGLALHNSEEYLESGEKSRKNLDESCRLGHFPDFYFDFGEGEIKFGSNLERYYALFLLEAKIIDKIIKGKNYQVPVEDISRDKRKTINLDFIINNLELAIEAHALNRDEFLDEEPYITKRQVELIKRGCNLKLIVMEKQADALYMLKIFRPEVSDEELIKEYYRINTTVNNKLKNYDKKRKELDEKYAEETYPF